MRKQHSEACTDAVMHVGGDLPPFSECGIHDFQLGLLAELPKSVNKNRDCDHPRSEHEPAQGKNVKVPDILSAEIVGIVTNRHVKRRGLRSHESADPCDVIKAAEAVESTALFSRDYPVVDA